MPLAADTLAPALTVSRRLRAGPEQIFDAWLDPSAGAWLFATPDGISAHVEIDARIGGGFAIHEKRGAALATHYGEYLELARPRRLVFSFGSEKGKSASIVEVGIAPGRDGGSRVTLTHQIDPQWAPRRAAIEAGWEGILAGLARATGEAEAGHSLIIQRSFAAPRLLVWKMWTEAEHMMRWLCPAGFTVLFAEADLKVGGKWRSGMRSPEGEVFIAGGEYLDIERPSRLVLTHIWEENHLEPKARTKVSVTLLERDGETDMIFAQSGLGSRESAASHKWGWSGAFDNLAQSAGAPAQP